MRRTSPSSTFTHTATVVFENCLASLEFVNCSGVQVQILGKVPTISIDKTDGIQAGPITPRRHVTPRRCT